VEHEAIAEGGPFQGSLNVKVECPPGGDWPRQVVWTTGPGPDQRHLYRFKTVSVSLFGGVPVYEFVKTLATSLGHSVDSTTSMPRSAKTLGGWHGRG
jgi:hypothetical protein